MRASLVFPFGLCLAACTAGKTFIATASDYEAYRETRTSKTLSLRLAADAKYLKDRPQGVYRDDVKADVAEHEPRFYKATEKTREGLEGYLELFPDGPHAGDARIALGMVKAHEESPDALAKAAEETRRELDANARSRSGALALLTGWFDGLMSAASYASSLGAGPRELVVPFSLGLPAPVCEAFDPPKDGVARRCKKPERADFVIPFKKAFAEREVLFDVTLDLDARDVPLRASIAGPDLFERIEETYIEPAELEDEPTLRAASIERIKEIVASAFAGHVSSDPACTKADLQPPDVLELACKGLRVTVTSGGAPGADDFIFIEPLAAETKE